MAVGGVLPAGAGQPPGASAANLAAGGRLEAALALLDTWLADNPGDPQLFSVLVQVVTAAPRQRTVEAVVPRYERALTADQVGVLRAVPADWAELRGAMVQALQALEPPGIPHAAERRAALLLELGQVAPDLMQGGTPVTVNAGLARYGDGDLEAALEPSLRAAFGSATEPADGGAGGAVAGYGLVSLLAANGRAVEAAAVLEQLRRRYPRSPEYALAAAELDRSAAVRAVVAFPSPAMLLGATAVTCLPLCAPRDAPLPADVPGGPWQTVPVAEPPPAPGQPVSESTLPATVASAPAPVTVESTPTPGTASTRRTDLPIRVTTLPSTPPTGTTVVATPVRVSAVPAPANAHATPALRDSVVRVAAVPDPAAFIVQSGAYTDPDNALQMELQLREAGFSAVARSYRGKDGNIVHRVALGGNVPLTKAEQLLARLEDAGYGGYITRRDDASHLPPAPRVR